MADDFLQPQTQYGEKSVQAELLREAPISGAPTPPSAPMAGSATAPVPQAQPIVPAPPAQEAAAGYYRNVADTWSKLARTQHASPVVRAFAKMARDYAKRVEAGEV